MTESGPGNDYASWYAYMHAKPSNLTDPLGLTPSDLRNVISNWGFSPDPHPPWSYTPANKTLDELLADDQHRGQDLLTKALDDYVAPALEDAWQSHLDFHKNIRDAVAKAAANGTGYDPYPEGAIGAAGIGAAAATGGAALLNETIVAGYYTGTTAVAAYATPAALGALAVEAIWIGVDIIQGWNEGSATGKK